LLVLIGLAWKMLLLLQVFIVVLPMLLLPLPPPLNSWPLTRTV
jgi:hypothetical protein